MIQLKIKGPNKKFIIQSLRCQLKNKNELLDLCKYKSISPSSYKLSKQKFEPIRKKYFNCQQRKSMQNIDTKKGQLSVQKYSKESNLSTLQILNFQKYNKATTLTNSSNIECELNCLNYFKVKHIAKDNLLQEKQGKFNSGQNRDIKQLETILINKNNSELERQKQFLLKPVNKNISLNEYIKSIMESKKYRQLKSNLMKNHNQNEPTFLQQLQLNGQQILVHGLESQHKNSCENKNDKIQESIQKFYRKCNQLQKEQNNNDFSKLKYQKLPQQHLNYIKYLQSANKWNMIRRYNSIETSYKNKKIKRFNTQNSQNQNSQNKKYQLIRSQTEENQKTIGKQIQIKNKKQQRQSCFPQIQILKNSLGPWDQQINKFKSKVYKKIIKTNENDDSLIKKRKKTSFLS